MNETRYDWLSDRWVIFAPNREERPDQYRQSVPTAANELIECPFCSGHEHETPNPTLVLPENDFDETTTNRKQHSASRSRLPWQVRVVPNKFPAVPTLDSGRLDSGRLDSGRLDSGRLDSGRLDSGRLDSGRLDSGRLDSGRLDSGRLDSPNFNIPHFSNASSSLLPDDGALCLSPQSHVQTVQAEHLFQRNKPRGAHEVIIESPIHVDSITDLAEDHISLILEAYRRRLNHWRAQRDLKYAVIFKNYGSDAGASLYHSHSQLISLDFVPRDIEKVNQRLVYHQQKYGCCYICQVMHEEEERQERILTSSEHFVALCPFASRFPYSFSIIPRAHKSRYEEVSESEREDLAIVVKKTLAALESAQPSAAYNFVLQTSPFTGGHEESYHWRLRVIPRLSKVAGFEWGSDCFINTVTPEQAAKTLRAHLR